MEHEVAQEKITLSLKNRTDFTAGALGEATPSFEVMNPGLLICTLDSSAKLDIEITIVGKVVDMFLRKITSPRTLHSDISLRMRSSPRSRMSSIRSKIPVSNNARISKN